MRPDPSHSPRVVVMGTTPDYIALIERRYPGRAVFVTDRAERRRGREPAPRHEVLADLSAHGETLARAERFLRRRRLRPSGVACFDDESMLLAARAARRWGLPYPSEAAVAACRSKDWSKRRWRRAGLSCPASRRVRTAAEAARFVARHGPSLLKPLTGSGSELLVVCRTAAECGAGVRLLRRRLARPGNARLYTPYGAGAARVDPRRTFLIERLVGGREYSCDFLVADGRARPVRVAGKLAAPGQSPGTTLAYWVPARLPPGLGRRALAALLARAARVVGLARGLCMLDFMVDGGRAWLLEIAPRPGGDCLPPLIRRSSGLDMLGLALDAAEGRPLRLPPARRWRPRVGLRLLAREAGRIRAIGVRALRRDPRVEEVALKRRPGDRVILPPADYDSRVLGHVIFRPGPGPVAAQCRALERAFTVAYA